MSALAIARRLALRNAFRRPVMLSDVRFMGSASEGAGDMRLKLTSELKAAMKAKDSVRSTALRSVLSEVYAADKSPSIKDGVASSAAIVGIIRKGLQRRMDAADQYEKASRADLAAKEKQEVEILEGLLPPLLSEAEIDSIIKKVIDDHAHLTPTLDPNPKRSRGFVLKWFYETVDQSRVDAQLVNKKVDAYMTAARFRPPPPATT